MYVLFAIASACETVESPAGRAHLALRAAVGGLRGRRRRRGRRGGRRRGARAGQQAAEAEAADARVDAPRGAQPRAHARRRREDGGARRRRRRRGRRGLGRERVLRGRLRHRQRRGRPQIRERRRGHQYALTLLTPYSNFPCAASTHTISQPLSFVSIGSLFKQSTSTHSFTSRTSTSHWWHAN